MRAGQGHVSPAKEAAYIAVTCALLTGGQYVFSFVVGVEIVTLILACFSSVFGVRRGVVLATAFSLLRCFIFGFTPATFVLYLVYYPAFAAIFGALGKTRDFGKKSTVIAVNALLLAICAACALCFALDLIKVSQVYKVAVQIFLWIIFALCLALTVAYDALVILRKEGCGELKKVVVFAAVAAVCTIFFTLLDDALSPLFLGMSRLSALAYFYASFTAMLPQTVCAIISVSALFLPITRIMHRFVR